jgi:hypothetical protein
VTSYFHIRTVVITVRLTSYSWLSMPLYVVAVVHFVILRSSSRSGAKGMLCARSGLRTATVRGNDCHGEGWYHRLVQFCIPQKVGITDLFSFVYCRRLVSQTCSVLCTAEGWYHRLVQFCVPQKVGITDLFSFVYHIRITEDLSRLEYDAMLISK